MKDIIVYLAGNSLRFDKVHELYKEKNSMILITSFNDKNKLRGDKSLLKKNMKIFMMMTLLLNIFQLTHLIMLLKLKEY